MQFNRFGLYALFGTGLALSLQGFRFLQQESKFISRQEVKEHNTIDKRVWVTHGNNVYDITSFIEGHPGGKRILMAAGGPVEPYWKVYSIHQKKEVYEILEQFKIGELNPNEKEEVQSSPINVQDPFAMDPVRSPLLVVKSQKPFNAETPTQILTDSFVTPNEIFYKRNHLPVPKIDDLSNYKLLVSADDEKLPQKSFLLDELKNKFKLQQEYVTLQCAGNRRAEMQKSGQVQGLLWEGGAIGNAQWKGVSLREVIKQSFPDTNEDFLLENYKHVTFDGLDGYGASVPIEKVMDKSGDVMLVWEMNGEDLLPDHGYPLRVLIPGHVAARSVKWVNKITLSKEESNSHWQRNDYKSFIPSTNWDKIDWTKAKSIQELPVQSQICSHSPEQTIQKSEEQITISGYAWSGGGKGINRVDVSPDGGKTWIEAELLERPEQSHNKNWAWTLWQAEIQIPTDKNEMELVCKAVDSAYNSQPESSDGIYNRRGVLNNSYNRVRIKLVDQNQ